MAQRLDERLERRRLQAEIGEDTGVHGGRGATGELTTLRGDGGQRAPAVVGLGWRVTKPSASSRSIALVSWPHLPAGAPDLAQRQTAPGRERQQHHHLVTRKGKPECSQLRVRRAKNTCCRRMMDVIVAMAGASRPHPCAVHCAAPRRSGRTAGGVARAPRTLANRTVRAPVRRAPCR